METVKELNKEQKKDTSNFFDYYIRLMTRLGHMPSLTACIIKNNEVVWSKGYGKYDLKK